MKTPAQRAAETRREYTFEDKWVRSPFLDRPRSMKYLRTLAERVWREQDIKRPLPEILAGPGELCNGRRRSWCMSTGRNTSRIVLARHERNVAVLLHELVHALGEHYAFHDVRFVKKLLQFMVRYGRENEERLILGAHAFGIWVKELTI
jgi:hypothetical protein